MSMTNFFLITAPLLSGLSVAAGAFASHALKTRLDEKALDIWQTAAQYQMYHALALLFVSLLLLQNSNVPQNLLIAAGLAFVAGIVLFSGSLYVLSFSGIKILGIIAPLGGLAFILGWICLAIAGWMFAQN